MVRVFAFIEPCLPSRAERPPSGPGWVHEIKHDGFRLMVRGDSAGIRLITRNGHDWSGRFPLIAQAAGLEGALVPSGRGGGRLRPGWPAVLRPAALPTRGRDRVPLRLRPPGTQWARFAA